MRRLLSLDIKLHINIYEGSCICVTGSVILWLENLSSTLRKTAEQFSQDVWSSRRLLSVTHRHRHPCTWPKGDMRTVYSVRWSGPPSTSCYMGSLCPSQGSTNLPPSRPQVNVLNADLTWVVNVFNVVFLVSVNTHGHFIGAWENLKEVLKCCYFWILETCQTYILMMCKSKMTQNRIFPFHICQRGAYTCWHMLARHY